jgi:outer membrane protein OmpA-like peptidoglycan-associated protein/tetratricopeptide (TPR) repeat protein
MPFVSTTTGILPTKTMMKISRYIPLIFLFCFQETAAQPLAKLKEEGLNFYERGKFGEAFELLSRFEEQKTGDVIVETALGITAFQLNKLNLAKQYLQAAMAASGKKVEPAILLGLGRIAHAEMNFKEAIKTYKKFLAATEDKNPERRRVIGDIQRCASGMKIVLQSDIALVENLGEAVNSRFDEFAPLQSPTFDDRVYFSATRDDAAGGLRNANCLPDKKNGYYFTDIYYTEIEGTDWKTPKRIESELINTPHHELLLDIVNGGKTLIFYRSVNGFSGDIIVDTFRTNEETRTVLNPKLVSPMKPENGDNSLYFFNDTILVFAARLPEGVGGLDLYFSVKQNDGWSAPKNLGKGVNSPYDETAPYLAKDGRTLYFSSNSTVSMGGYDIFKATFDEDSLRFRPAENLGKPINSPGDDMYFRLSPDGLGGYFCSNRKESFGGRDIYSALFKGQQRVQNPSNPISFHMVERFKAERDSAKAKEIKVVELTLAPIFYDADDDLLRGANLTQVRTLLNTTKQFPSLKVILMANCAEGEKSNLDLYFTMKRVEAIYKYLITNGLTPDQIVVKSVGSEYPIAQTSINGQINVAGEKLNKRIDIGLVDLATPPASLKIKYNTPVVSEFMTNSAGDKLKKHASGLTYKVNILSTKRIYDNEILTKFGDAMVEINPNDGSYLYTVGLLTDYASAEKMRAELLKANMREAIVVPYLNGVRLTDENAKRWTNKYPDLLNYLATKRKP